MFKEELAKNSTKKMLYGAMLDELNSHMLEMTGLPYDGIHVVWGDPLPVSEMEEIQALTADYALGVVSKRTAAGIRNYDYDEESSRLAEERASANALGGDLLRNFLAGRGEGTNA
jgi:hypothetical protein